MPEEIAILFALTIGAGTIISLAWMWTRYLERRPRPGQVDDGHTRQELEDVRARLEAVEERLDFAERLLAQQKDRPALGGDR